MLWIAATVMVAAGVVLALLAAGVWRRRRNPAGLSLACMLLAVAWWGLTYALELSSTDLSVRQAWGDAKYAGTGALGVAWLAFVLQYTGRAHLVTRRRVIAFLVEPLAVLVVLAIPATHDLVRSYPPRTAPGEIPVARTGPLFWVHFGYSNLVLLLATVLFVVAMVRLGRVYWRLAAVLLAAAMLPWAANILHNFEVGPFTRLDLTPFAFTVTGAVLVWGLHRERLVDLQPVARAVIVETMADAVLVMDAYGRVVDANPAAAQVVGRASDNLVGHPLADLLPRQPTLTDGPANAPGLVDEGEVTLTVDGQRRYFDARRQPLNDQRGRTAGELVVLRDVTERKAAETQLRLLLAERSRVAAALQQSLVPSTLPTIPGLSLAGRYAPAGDGREIGGDFYDVFPLESDRWVIVLGDVSGKGAEAAAVTAVIRYTLRALAADGRPPAAVLRSLNDTLLRDSAHERYATLVYAVAEPHPAGWQVSVCLAGHHPPLLRRQNGCIQPVGRLGTALGLLTDPELSVEPVLMQRGDVLCLFTDGLVEARRRNELFGEARTRQLLVDGRPDRLDVMAQQLENAARDFRGGPLSDDLALLLLRADDGHDVAASATSAG